MEVRLGSRVIVNGAHISPYRAKRRLKISWDDSNDLHTLLIFSKVFDPGTFMSRHRFIHFLLVNIPGNKVAYGRVVYPFVDLLALTVEMQVSIYLFRQRAPIDTINNTNRHTFYPATFIGLNSSIVAKYQNWFSVNPRNDNNREKDEEIFERRRRTSIPPTWFLQIT